jgi:hypothetical protein
MVLDNLARWLALRGLGVYDPTGAAQTADWSVFPDDMPDSPNLVIGLFQYPGEAYPDAGQPWEDVRVQIRVRGTADPTLSRSRAQAIYNAVHGLGPLELPAGLWLQLAVAVNAGVFGLGRDPSGRHEHVCNFELSIINPTDTRPGP